MGDRYDVLGAVPEVALQHAHVAMRRELHQDLSRDAGRAREVGGGELLVALPEPLAAGESVELAVAYTGRFAAQPAGDKYWSLAWDGWLPMATLWASEKKRTQYRASFLNRRMDAEGYVSMQQHRGMAHSEGWPFPAWQQSTGAGFHFSIADEVWAIQNFALRPLANMDGWEPYFRVHRAISATCVK